MREESIPTEKMKLLISELVEEKLSELLGDPDADKEIKEEVIERLKKSANPEEDDSENLSADDFAKNTGLKW